MANAPGAGSGNPSRPSHRTRNIALVVIIALAGIGLLFYVGSVTTEYGCPGCSSAQVAVTSVQCTGSAEMCVLSMVNTGTAATTATACYVQDQGKPVEGVIPAGSVALWPGTTPTDVKCSFAIPPQASGTSATGSVSLGNGASVPWAGIWA